jgi:hypothetical protein
MKQQGYDSLTALAELKDQTCTDLITLIRRPGGTIPNPVQPDADISNPGIKVGHQALMNLKTAAFVSRPLVCTSRPLDSLATILTPLFLAGLHGLKEAEDTYTHPPPIPTLDKIERIWGHIEDINVQLLKMLGMAKAPLAYVVRQDEAVATHNSDPSNGYATVQEEMVACMPHTHPLYHEDNIDILRDSIHDTKAFPWIKRCKKQRDG